MMTDEQFKALAPYEDLFDKVLHNQPGKYPGRAVVEMMLSVIRTALPRYKTNLNCGTCVKHLIQDAGRMYFGEKKTREESKPQEPVKEEEPKPDKAKKATRKKKAE